MDIEEVSRRLRRIPLGKVSEFPFHLEIDVVPGNDHVGLNVSVRSRDMGQGLIAESRYMFDLLELQGRDLEKRAMAKIEELIREIISLILEEGLARLFGRPSPTLEKK